MMGFLTFSDSAKFADVARNLISGLGYHSSFSFWSAWIFGYIKQTLFSASGIPPVMPFSIAVTFKILGVSDFSVITTSFFYFLLTLVFVFLLARKIFRNNLAGFLSTIAVGFNYDIIHYALNGASESPFIFEIVAASYFITLKKKWGSVAALLTLILMYFTRPQSLIYIAGLILYWLLLNFNIKKTLIIFAGILTFGFLIDYFVLPNLSGKFFLYSFTSRGFGTATQVAAGGSASDSLRGGAVLSSGLLSIAKKVFYNLYNFYKLLPQIINPYLFILFVIGLLKWGPPSLKTSEGQGKIYGAFKVVSVFMVAVTLLVTAASIPFFRYIHPIIPLVYIIAVGTLVEFVNFRITKQRASILISTFLILFFAAGQTIGVFLLDSRFEAKIHNSGKSSVYVNLSYKLRENTSKDQLIITNLDTWGSWYGERKTIWFPVEPKQIIDPTTSNIPFDAIYLTSYLIDDENYYMGAGWREIFNNPTDLKKWTCDGCGEIAKEFRLKGVYKISADDNYENQDASAILLIRK